MLGDTAAAVEVQEVDVHRLGNLTITAYNSTLSNNAFTDKRNRVDSAGRLIGYRNGLSLNSSLAAKEPWTVLDIDARTDELASEVIARFQL